jgi:excisionase family DNA binding protein
VGNPGDDPVDTVYSLVPDSTVATPHGAPVVRKSEIPVGTLRLLTVRDQAERLSVCTATVYALCGCGEIRHLRVSNAIRIHPDDLEAFIASKRDPKG